MTAEEPGKILSASLALAVHALFFLLLGFGVSWQRHAPQPMTVDLWGTLPPLPAVEARHAKPEPPSAPEPEPQTVAKAEPRTAPIPAKQAAPKPAVPSKADILLRDKKLREQKQQEEARLAALKAQQAALADAARVRAEQEDALRRLHQQQATAQERLKDEYKNRIMNKIRRYVVLPPDLAGNPQAEYRVTLLPGGDVMSAKLVKSSGNAAYDGAIERAIYKAQPLPLPPDAALFSAFRELELQFRPQQ